MTDIKKLSVVETTRQMVRVDRIEPSALNPRYVVDTGTRPGSEWDKRLLDALRELGEHMRRAGQLDSVLVRPIPGVDGKYELVDGTRRCLAARMVGIGELRCEVGPYTDEHILLYAYATGTHRAQLSAIEEAQGFGETLKREGMTMRSIADIIGRSESYVSRRMVLLRAPEKTRRGVLEGWVPSHTAYLIARLPDDASRLGAERVVIEPNGLTGTVMPWREAEDTLNAMFGARSRVLEAHAKLLVAAPDRVVPIEENDRIFPKGAADVPSPESGYVAFTRPLPEWLLKPEVSAEGAPRARDVAGEGVAIHLAVDHEGRVVEVVRLGELVTSVRREDAEIFRRDVARKYGVGQDEKRVLDLAATDSVKWTAERIAGHLGMTVDYVRGVLVAAAEEGGHGPSGGSIVVGEKAGKKAKAAADRGRAKKQRATRVWLGELFDVLSMDSPAWRDMSLWSLLWEHALRVCADEDALLVFRALVGKDCEPFRGKSARECLSEYVAEVRTPAEVRGVAVLLLLSSSVAAAGVDAGWVVDWHKHIVAAEGGRGDVATGGQVSVEDPKRLAEIKKAYELGMSAHKIADTFGTSLGDVCGILDLDEDAEVTRIDGLEAEVLRELDERGYKSVEVRDRISQWACNKPFYRATFREDMEAILRCIRKPSRGMVRDLEKTGEEDE
jgi:ParB/RepB/Spo0J family partition protein